MDNCQRGRIARSIAAGYGIDGMNLEMIGEKLKSNAAILFVDDCRASGAFVKQALSEVTSDYGLEFIDDGAAAIEYLRRVAEDDAALGPRVILVDVNMPRMNGLEFLRKVRADKGIPPVSIIMMTTSRLQSDVDEAYRCGANAYVVKPLELPAWEELLRSVVTFWLEFAEVPDGEYHERQAEQSQGPLLDASMN